jgi:hypothetical protein
MILLDTDHLSVLSNRSAGAHAALIGRMTAFPDQEFAIPVVAVEEQCRGWLALINKLRDVHGQVEPYDRLTPVD